ncbi:MAG: hypothetical protein ACI8WB_000837 [Phenylobacterium sp.]|jgi:hypothetical protein
MNDSPAAQNDLFERIHTLVTTARLQVRRTVNTTMVQTYWQIGQLDNWTINCRRRTAR